MENEITVGGCNYRFITIKRMNTKKTSFSMQGAVPELFIERNIYGEEQYCIGYLEKTVTLVLYSREEREQLLSYLSDKRTDSHLLFVSGYNLKDEVIEFINRNESKNKSETWWDDIVGYVDKTPVASDSREYWGSPLVDNFVTRLRPKKVTYMAGHDNIGTSNHQTMFKFLVSLESSNSLIPSNVMLNTTPNLPGFNQRRKNGKRRGADYVNQLKSGCLKGPDGLVQDTVDIVCHSMGFAHALGIIDAIREAMQTDLKGLKFGRFYIIAPENACSGEVNVEEWSEVWQYGTDEANTPRRLQDGVAPQCKIEGLDEKQGKSGRAYIPQGERQGFLESHSIKNYGWIFTRTINDNGYVTPRK